LGMRERVSSLGGQLFLQSAPGRGFQVQAVLPLEAA
jgi:signal transduction histidine kinase